MVIKGIRLAVVTSRSQHARNGIWPQATSICSLYPIQVSCTLTVFLGADIARGGQFGQHLIDVLRGLPFQTRRLRLWPLLVLAWASALRGG